MRVKKVNGVEIATNLTEVLEYLGDIIAQVSNHKYQAFEIDFSWLEKIVFFDSFEEIRNYRLESGKWIASEADWDRSNGCYEPRDRAIYLFNSSEVKAGGRIHIATTLLHELSHYIMDTYDLLSRTRYSGDPIYRCFEEIRVNNMSLYLAKAIFGGEVLTHFESYVREYRQFMYRLISSAKQQGHEKLYLRNGRGVASLMQMGELDL